MKQITCNWIEYTNLGPLKSFRMELNGKDGELIGKNGVGKSRCHTGLLWLMYGKDNSGRHDTHFKLRPLDEKNSYRSGLIVSVEAKFTINKEDEAQWEVLLKRQSHEQLNKEGQVKGYTGKYWVDEKPCTKSEYDKAVSELIPEDVCKILTDLYYFCGKLHWSDRRKVLLDFAGDAGTPEGFEELVKIMGRRDVKDYRKILTRRQQGFEEERGSLKYRREEVVGRMESYEAGDSEPELVAKRELADEVLTGLNTRRKDLAAAERLRAQKLEEKQSLVQQRTELQGNIKAQAVASLIKEKADCDRGMYEAIGALTAAQQKRAGIVMELESARMSVASAQKQLDTVRAEYQKIKNTQLTTNCYACGQPMPQEKINEQKNKKGERLKELRVQATGMKSGVEEWNQTIEDLEAKLKTSDDSVQRAAQNSTEVNATMADMKAGIDKAIESQPDPDYSKDEKWQELTKQIERLDAEAGNPLSDQISDLDTLRQALEKDIANLNRALAAADQNAKDVIRLKELDDRKKELSQLIADVQAELDELAAFTVQQSLGIEMNVNDKFDGIEWSLFDYKLNGEVDDSKCDALYRNAAGSKVPFDELSTGEQVKVGVSVINTLSDYYDISVPLFIDHCESVTLEAEPRSQAIWLTADRNVQELELRIL